MSMSCWERRYWELMIAIASKEAIVLQWQGEEKTGRQLWRVILHYSSYDLSYGDDHRLVFRLFSLLVPSSIIVILGSICLQANRIPCSCSNRPTQPHCEHSPYVSQGAQWLIYFLQFPNFWAPSIIIIFIRTRSTQNEQIIQKIDGTVLQILKIKGEWTINSWL